MRRRGRPSARFRHFRKHCPPEVRFWLIVGLAPASATALAQAGYGSLSDLAGVTQETLLAIPKIGPRSLEVLEDALGRPIPWTRKRRTSPPEARPFSDVVWRKRGLPTAAAITFAIEGMTLERLRSSYREDLLAMAGVGTKSIQACELLLGLRLPSRKIGPVEAFWRGKGLSPRLAKIMSRAGVASLEDLQKQSREDLLAVRGLGEAGLADLEALLGCTIPSRTAFWLDLGLHRPIANALAREGILSLTELARLTREQFLSFRGLSKWALWQCEKLLGHKLTSIQKEPHVSGS